VDCRCSLWRALLEARNADFGSLLTSLQVGIFTLRIFSMVCSETSPGSPLARLLSSNQISPNAAIASSSLKVTPRREQRDEMFIETLHLLKQILSRTV
jgi:hypothetical protein